MTIRTLITHSGSFHPDDLLSYAVLSSLHPDARLLRTRDKSITGSEDPETIIFDVGNRYCPEKNLFDHHQPDKPMREPGLPYSSFGLIWKHFGAAYLKQIVGVEAEDIPAVSEKLDKYFVRDIDAIDNGAPQPDQAGVTHPMTLASLLMDFRPDFDDETPQAMDTAFKEASQTAAEFLRRRIKKISAGLRSEKIVQKAIQERVHPNWIELPRGMNYLGAILASGEEDILFVVNPSPGEWQLNCVNVARDTYDLRKDLPQAWAGLRDKDLAEITGVEDAIFCHANRFIAAAESRDGVLKLLDQALSA